MSHLSSDEKVIVDGRHLYSGHKDAWRAGVVIKGSAETVNVNTTFVDVLHEPRGRERKSRLLRWPANWLLLDTPEIRSQLARAGIKEIA